MITSVNKRSNAAPCSMSASVKVLFTSGYTENAIFHHGRLDPDIILLPKPYRKSDLARVVRVAISSPLTPSLKRLLECS
jgi:hypothetical protein